MANCVNGAAMRSIDRRGVLRGLAGSALAGPLAQIFRMHTGRAAGAMALPKVVFFYTPCGVQLPMWHPTQTGTTFTLPRLSAPLQPYASDCIFMDGVCMAPLTDHQGGSQQMLVGDDKDVKTLYLRLGEHLQPRRDDRDTSVLFGFLEVQSNGLYSSAGQRSKPGELQPDGQPGCRGRLADGNRSFGSSLRTNSSRDAPLRAYQCAQSHYRVGRLWCPRFVPLQRPAWAAHRQRDASTKGCEVDGVAELPRMVCAEARAVHRHAEVNARRYRGVAPRQHHSVSLLRAR